MKATFGMTLNRTDMAACAGIDVKTLDAWVREGCPIAREGSRGVPAEFNSADVWKWHEARLRAKLVAPVQQRRDEYELRKLAAQAEAAEIDLMKTKGLLAPIEEFHKVWAARCALIRTTILNVPQRAVLQLLNERDESIWKKKLRAELTDALIQSAQDIPLEELDELAAQADDETDPQPV